MTHPKVDEPLAAATRLGVPFADFDEMQAVDLREFSRPLFGDVTESPVSRFVGRMGDRMSARRASEVVRLGGVGRDESTLGHYVLPTEDSMVAVGVPGGAAQAGSLLPCQ